MKNFNPIRTLIAAVLIATPVAALAHTPAPTHQRTLVAHDRTPQAHVRTISAAHGR